MSYRRWLATMLLGAAISCAWAADSPPGNGPTPLPHGEPVADAAIEDPEFGVRSTRFGLDRQVEMYQWQGDGRGGFQQVWKPALVDSSTFPAEYSNPTSFPLENRIWWATRVTLDGKPVALPVLKALGQWQDFRPSFTRLPANLAATFQPEGDGLGSALNPLDPLVGDLRIRWRTLHLPPLAGKIELRDGQWQLAELQRPAAPVAKPLQAQSPATAANQPPASDQDVGLGKVLLGVAILLGALLLLGLFQRKRRRPQA